MSAPDGFAQEMIQLEIEIKRLETEYNQFFAGRTKRLPRERRARIEATIRKHDRAPRLNTAERFRFEAIQSRYVLLCQLWERTLREKER